jgi:hypothetical protein
VSASPGPGAGPEAFDGPEVVVRSADATDDEVAAVVAAVQAVWPRRSAVLSADEPSRWRFSGRWWSKPVPLRRSRPW